MNWKDTAVAALRGLSLAADLFGKSIISKYVAGVADLAESGADIEAHMSLINEKLKLRHANDEDWAEAEASIKADLDRLNN